MDIERGMSFDYNIEGSNCAFGRSVLNYTNSGIKNFTFGIENMNFLTIGGFNNSFGFHSLFKITTGSYNNAFGAEALDNILDGSQNSAFGSHASQAGISIVGTSVFGFKASANNVSGSYITAMGWEALYNLQSGGSNVAFGSQALFSNINGSDNVALGTNAGYYETGSSKLWIDNRKRNDLSDAQSKALIYGNFASTVADQFLNINGALKVAIGFGCNGMAAQPSYASGGAVTTSSGSYGFGSDAERSSLTTLVSNIRFALIANGIMS